MDWLWQALVTIGLIIYSTYVAMHLQGFRFKRKDPSDG
jgi:hypothetical protein